MASIELTCRACGWRTISGRADAIGRLRRVGLLRRDSDPSDELIETLLVESAPKLACPACEAQGLVASAYADDSDDDDWQAAILCEICRQAIPPERVEALPGTRRCVSCQGKAEAGDIGDEEPDFCPHCGALVELRVSTGSGITRYRRFCTGTPRCRLA